MLNVTFGDKTRRISRRNVLKVGALSVGGATLADALRTKSLAADENKPATKKRSVICFWLDGGPPQHETFDPKPNAPREFRGAYEAIPTAVPGFFYSEWFPKLAAVADKSSVIRSVYHNSADHYAGAHWMWTGHFGATFPSPAPRNPCIGSIVAKCVGSNRPGMPPFVSVPLAISNDMKPGYQQAAFLGSEYNAFDTGGNPALPDFKVRDLGLPNGVVQNRVEDRDALLAGLDSLRRDVDNSRLMSGMDVFRRRAFELMTGPDVRDAFDIAKEPTALRTKYGMNQIGQSSLLARRLVEAGVTFVTVNSIAGAFDHHLNLHQRMVIYSQPFDAAIASLIEDLHDRGMQDDVLVLAMGEFGRTPKINANAGRDHWGGVFPVLLFGGGLKAGQFVGSSDRVGAVPRDRPITPGDVFSTLYGQIGIDPTQRNTDRTGRPIPILPEGKPIAELI